MTNPYQPTPPPNGPQPPNQPPYGQQPPPHPNYQQGPPPPLQYQQPYYMPPSRPTNGKAIASMILGILSIMMYVFAFVLGPIAIILAKQAKDEIMARGESGEGFATAGKVTGIIGLCFFCLMAIFIFIVILSVPHHHQRY